MSDKAPADPFLRIIALFKLVKSALFIIAGIGLLRFLNKDIESRLLELMNSLHVDSHNHIANWCLDAAGKLTNTKIETISAVAFFYGTLFAIEGTGLFLRKRWAEWFVVFMTASLLPLEGYEIWHEITLVKVLLTIGNLIILGYLIHVIRQKQKA